MVRAVWQGVHKPACSPITSTMFGFDPATCNVYRYDPKKAGELLDEAGWKMGPGGVRRKDGQDLALALYYRSDNPDFAAMATFLQSMYQQIGIKIDLNGLAQAGYFNAVRAGQHNLQFWWDTRTDPDMVRILLYSANANGGTNRNRYKNAEMDKLIDEAAGSTDPAKRKRLYTEIQMKMLQEAIMVFFADPLNVFAYQKAKVMGRDARLVGDQRAPPQRLAPTVGAGAVAVEGGRGDRESGGPAGASPPAARESPAPRGRGGGR